MISITLFGFATLDINLGPGGIGFAVALRGGAVGHGGDTGLMAWLYDWWRGERRQLAPMLTYDPEPGPN